MKRRFRAPVACAITALAPFITSCTKNVSRVTTARLPAKNPTAFVFHAPAAATHDRIVEALSSSNAPDAIFGRRETPGDETEYADYFSVEDARDPTFGKSILTTPGNERDIY